jgi:hypothetical protein
LTEKHLEALKKPFLSYIWMSHDQVQNYYLQFMLTWW